MVDSGFFANHRTKMQNRVCQRISDVCMGVLWYIFEHRQYFVDDVVSLKIGNYILKFTVGDASDFGFYIVEVLRVVRQEHFELFLTHRCCQFLNFRDKFVSDSP